MAHKVFSALVLSAVLGAVVIAPAGAALLPRLGGLAVYDTDQDLTWLANANLARTESFGIARIAQDAVYDAVGILPDGTMSWQVANLWIEGMNNAGANGYLGYNDWRLPFTPSPDDSCEGTLYATGFNCTGSEMGHLYYRDLAGEVRGNVYISADPDLALFRNISLYDSVYFSGNPFELPKPGMPNALVWTFYFNHGIQLITTEYVKLHAWAVRDGDVAVVPVPAAGWLFASGLFLLVGLRRREKR